MYNNIVFSVIIPHKNCPDLLCKCINSIPNRDDIEIIVVDDNSSQEIVDFKNFPGIDRKNLKIIFDKSNKGAGRARNIGIGEAQGHWLLFADADDYFIKDELNLMLNKFIDITDVDVVYLNAQSYIGESSRLSANQPRINRIISNKDKLGKEFESQLRFETWEPWTRMCNRSFITKNCILFDEVPRMNDMSFGKKVSLFAQKWKIEENAIYCWIEWPKTLSRQKMSDSAFRLLLRIQLELDILSRSLFPEKKVFFLYYIYRNPPLERKAMQG